MSQKTYIREDEVYSLGLVDIKTFEGREDVATFLAAYDMAKQDVDYMKIKSAKMDEYRNYYFVVGKTVSMPLDIVKFIKQHYPVQQVTSANVKLLFPKELSRQSKANNRGEHRRTRMVSGVLPMVVYDERGYTIPPKGSLVFGRGDDGVNVKIRGNGDVSRRHCKIYYDDSDGCIKIDDLKSKNGTYVNSHKLAKGEVGYVLDIGDRISFAGERLEIREN